MLKLKVYSPLTSFEVVTALEIENYDGMAEQIAQDMLDGHIRFTRKELQLLARYKGVTVFQLVERDKQLQQYRLS